MMNEYERAVLDGFGQNYQFNPEIYERIFGTDFRIIVSKHFIISKKKIVMTKNNCDSRTGF